MHTAVAFGYTRGMQKTYTDALIRRLNAECLKRSKHGPCRMECDVFGAKLGYCREVWEKATK